MAYTKIIHRYKGKPSEFFIPNYEKGLDHFHS